MNHDDFNSSQDSQGSDELIIKNQSRRFKAANNQGKPAATSEQEKSDTQQKIC